MGARLEEYQAVAPHNSFIHVDQFKGPKELAEYLDQLDKDDDLYNEYFQGGPQFSSMFFMFLCSVERDWRVHKHSVFLSCLFGASL